MGAAAQHIREHIGDTHGFPFTNGSGAQIDGGTIHVVGNKVGMVRNDVPDTEDGILITFVPPPGVSVPRNTNDGAWSRGDEVFLDLDSSSNSNDQFTTQATTNTTSNPSVGYAYEDAASGDARARIVLTDEQI